MSNGVPLTDKLWSDLYRGTPVIPKYNLSSSQWTWLHQVGKIQSPSVDLSNLLVPIVNFYLINEIYWISLHFTENFPNQAPVVKCSYQAGFIFDWIVRDTASESSTLSSIISQYQQYITELDEALGTIKSIEEGLFALGLYFLDENDPELLVINFNLKGEMEEITAKINWKRPREFPQELRSSNPKRFDGIDCDRWDPDCSLSQNFARLCDLNNKFNDSFFC